MKLELTKVLVILFNLISWPQHAVAQGLSSPVLNQLPMAIQSTLRLEGIFDLSIQTYQESDAQRWREQSQSQLIASTEASLREAFQQKDELNRQRSQLRSQYWSDISRHNILQRWLEYHQRWLWDGTFAPRDRQLEQDLLAQEAEIQVRRSKLDELRHAGGRKTLEPHAELAAWIFLPTAPTYLGCEALETAVQFRPWREEAKEALPFGGHDREGKQFEFIGCQSTKQRITKLGVTDLRAPAISFVSDLEFDSKDQLRSITISRVQAGEVTALEKRVKAGSIWTIVPTDRSSRL